MQSVVQRVRKQGSQINRARQPGRVGVGGWGGGGRFGAGGSGSAGVPRGRIGAVRARERWGSHAPQEVANDAPARGLPGARGRQNDPPGHCSRAARPGKCKNAGAPRACAVMLGAQGGRGYPLPRPGARDALVQRKVHGARRVTCGAARAAGRRGGPARQPVVPGARTAADCARKGSTRAGSCRTCPGHCRNVAAGRRRGEAGGGLRAAGRARKRKVYRRATGAQKRGQGAKVVE